MLILLQSRLWFGAGGEDQSVLSSLSVVGYMDWKRSLSASDPVLRCSSCYPRVVVPAHYDKFES